MSETVIKIYARDGTPISELAAHAVFSSQLNEFGVASFEIAKTDAAATKTNLQFRNLVLIRDSVVGDWGGYIWTPRKWKYDTIEVNCRSAEGLFKLRRGPSVVLNGSAGDIFGTIVDYANAGESLQMVKGAIYSGGPVHQLTLQYDNLYDAVTRFTARAGNDFQLVPQIDGNNNLSFQANWYHQAGAVQNFTLEYGFDFKLPGGAVMTEQGDIVNDVLVFGGGATAGTTPVSTPQIDEGSRGEFGLIQQAYTNNSVVQATLDAQADAQLQLVKQPRRTFAIEIINNTTKNTFAYVNIGDVVGLRLTDIGFANTGGLGFEGSVRIKAKEYNTKSGTMSLTVDEYTG